jgi:chromosome condensin MukBEF MukE localization factor
MARKQTTGVGCDSDLLVGAVACYKILDPRRSGRTGGLTEIRQIFQFTKFLFFLQPIALDNLSAINESVTSLMRLTIGRKISLKSSDPRESIFLFQRLSVFLQRFNSILLRESFVLKDPNK